MASITRTTTPSSLAAAARRIFTNQTTSITPRRTFTSHPAALYKQQTLSPTEPPIPSPTAHQPHIPPYPLGDRPVYKQSNGGLYGSARIRFGNTVSERNEIKNRRAWRPNVQRKRLWSAALAAWVRTRATTRVLRTVDKEGGLDEYLLGGKAARLRELGPWGWKLRWRIMQTEAVRQRFAAERAALGLPPKVQEELGVPAELAAEGVTGESLVEETQRMIDGEEEFDLGGEEGFMKEEPRK
ncbi:uncharacterized protein E0L32_010512 [Thyridium curvatum]|uniref:Large ribosomal subunit protein bL28m n=1 Tax=Thyridium curvatum TaxID=1093900 RepID=A0A507AEQ6_9PEZI|nr:uncharacterized protein E0L32_010512 [Thyridium curvatum]TPX07825.1 hypothetical protein E0L32_010512 [Thyridium curvatum]